MVPKPKIDLSKQQKGQDFVIEELKNYSSEILKYSQARFDHTEVYKKKLAAVKAKVEVYEELAKWYRAYQVKVKRDQAEQERKMQQVNEKNQAIQNKLKGINEKMEHL